MLTKEKVIEVFKQCVDPELDIDIWTLGLIYEHKVNGKKVFVKMTFTSPMCPYGPQMVQEIESKLKEAGAETVEVEITFDPPWKPSDELRAILGV